MHTALNSATALTVFFYVFSNSLKLTWEVAIVHASPQTTHFSENDFLSSLLCLFVLLACQRTSMKNEKELFSSVCLCLFYRGEMMCSGFVEFLRKKPTNFQSKCITAEALVAVFAASISSEQVANHKVAG